MIEVVGDLFDHDVIGHGVNCQGLMGAGVAVGFRQRFPRMFHQYVQLCSQERLRPGDIQPWFENGTLGFNIASQDQPGPTAKILWLQRGLQKAANQAQYLNAPTLAIPRIGCGIGGLQWANVKTVIRDIEERNNFQITVVTLP
jgi:O-acetyl-ADP-ribose deacetylase (regulator of RNase III)